MDQEEWRSKLHDLAELRYVAIAASGKTIPWYQMRRYLEQRLAGKEVSRPTSRAPEQFNVNFENFPRLS